MDLPPGDWTGLLIGDQWPNSTSLTMLSAGAKARRLLANQFEHYSELLQQILNQNLAPQEGFTADNIREKFENGKRTADEVAHANRVKGNSYQSVHERVVSFRDFLRDLAAEGNSRIDEINKSKLPLPAKVTGITQVIVDVRARAASSAASCTGDIYSKIQDVLGAQGVDTSARAFAADNGIGANKVAATSPLDLENRITTKLQALQGATSTAETSSNGAIADSDEAGATVASGADGSSPSPAVERPTSSSSSTGATGTGGTGNAGDTGTTVNGTTASSSSTGGTGITSTPTSTSGSGNDLGTTSTSGSGTITSTSTSGPGSTGVGSSSSIGTAGTSTSGITGTTGASSALATPINTGATGVRNIANSPALATVATSAESATSPSGLSIEAPAAGLSPNALNPTGPQAPVNLSPTDLAQSFNTGSQTGAPVSASAEAISTAAASPVHTPPPAAFNAPLAEAAGSATPVFETAHAVPAPTADVIHTAPAPTELSQPVVAPTAQPAFAPPAAASMSPPISMPTATPPTGLLGYGADLKPPVSAVPSATPITPAAAGSAPVNPASGASPSGQPAVVRQQPTSVTAASAASAAGLTERAFAAAATGAVGGATTARSQANARLDRLLNAVARQQPQLHWAIGDHEDGSTVLVTNVASGWIPPGIDIPTGVRLLQPGTRHKDLVAMLGSTTLAVTYEPGQHLPPDEEPVQTSIRARDTAAVDDLGWELSQATRWRDGLPRLAHTLAKAASAKTGYLDSEVEMLRELLDAVRRSVLGKYPGTIDPVAVGNWQLLATIDALINDQKTLANYHFAWFQAQALTREGHR